jgi:hypothetical protein
VPETYDSRFLFGEPATRENTEPPPTSVSRPASRPRREQATDSFTAMSQDPYPRPTQHPSPRTSPPAMVMQRADPTVRQATGAFLTEAGAGAGAHRLTMVIVGRELGASTPLSRLDNPQTAAHLRTWLDDIYGASDAQRDHGVDTVRRALGHWHRQGWLTHDLAPSIE